ncbi:MAG: DUF72 domain-containing protein [Acidobacteria bacterium]|nr:DUF72 domain-containing protein [Acidobacteriota bacterium]
MIRVGPAGWSYKDWEGIVYPAAADSKFDPLSYLAQYFDAIEVNNTFYRPATARMASSWLRRTRHNRRFSFTCKLWNRFTHERQTPYGPAEVAEFTEGLRPLLEERRLGALLLQFPWSFKNGPGEREYLQRLLEDFHPFPRVVEVRHESWDQRSFYAFLRERGVGFCNIDQPVIGSSLSPSAIVTAPTSYFRLHGRNYQEWFREKAGVEARYDYLYSQKELDGLMGYIEDLSERTEDLFVITNNHFRGKAVCNAMEIKHRLGQPAEVPPAVADAFPRLKELKASPPASSGRKERE